MNSADEKISIKTDLSKFIKLEETVRDLPRNQDLTHLYNKIVPSLAKYEKVMHKYDTEHKKFKRLIIRFD